MEENIENKGLITIRKINANEKLEVFTLIWNVFLEFEAPDYLEEGIKTFKELLNDESKMKELDFYVAIINNEIVGTIAIRNISHITMLFIKKKYHKKGIGRELVTYIKSITKEDIITVNSSPYAIEFYHKLGFADTDKEKLIDGIKFTPMKYMKSTKKSNKIKQKN